MSTLHIIGIVLLVLIVVPVPLVWLFCALFPDGNVSGRVKRLRGYLAREWKRVALCVGVVIAMFIFAPDNAWQVVLLGGAVLVGWVVAVGRGM